MHKFNVYGHKFIKLVLKNFGYFCVKLPEKWIATPETIEKLSWMTIFWCINYLFQNLYFTSHLFFQIGTGKYQRFNEILFFCNPFPFQWYIICTLFIIIMVRNDKIKITWWNFSKNVTLIWSRTNNKFGPVRVYSHYKELLQCLYTLPDVYEISHCSL